ncbi:MAG: ATP-binding cassette domain-containing protein, partial [Clostridia bacterium]|nr:ATP-binding cassette domain-containing protein [Clostridia bacterium]
LFEIRDAEPDVRESKAPIIPAENKGEVEFRNVSFSYVENRKVIDDVSFSIPAGNTLGIVGQTGAGKSTLANLLTRLYDVKTGAIYIDGVNIKDLPFEYLRDNIAIVSQETYLFRGSILDNIRYARPDATREEVIAAAKTASAHDFIVKYPDGYNTEIGLGKKELSGSEKQRISIARALLRNPKILILDEATAAMDTQTERSIQAALDRLTKNRTTVIIAHRLSTLRNADNLIAIENGRVAETGTAEELLKQKGVYYKLYKLQAEALKTVGIE